MLDNTAFLGQVLHPDQQVMVVAAANQGRLLQLRGSYLSSLELGMLCIALTDPSAGHDDQPAFPMPLLLSNRDSPVASWLAVVVCKSFNQKIVKPAES